MRAEGVREFESHVAEAAKAHDADFLAGAGLPVAQRRVGGDAGAEKWGNGSKVEVGGDGMGEALVDNVVVGVSAHGDGAVDAVLGGVGERRALGAEVLFAAVARSAVAAGINDDADGCYFAGLELCCGFASGDDAANDLMTGNHGIDGVAPFVASHVEIGVADSAVEDFNGDFSGARLAAGKVVRSQRRFCVESGIAFGWRHEVFPFRREV